MKSISRSLGFFLLLTACSPTAPPTPTASVIPPPSPSPAAPDTGKAIVGQTLYVPVYSRIYYENRDRAMDLAATLSIRNTDRASSISIQEIAYNNSDGKLVKQYLDRPLTLPPLASRSFVVDRLDTTGGSGASFIVRWTASKPVTDPVVEAVMISAAISQGISFVSVGRVIDRFPR